MRKYFWTPAFVAVGLLGAAAPALASPPTTLTGCTGAMNMMHDPTMAPGTGGAMDHANAAGNAGMFHAVDVTHGTCGP